ncbi:MAG: GNAT family N-acetyltransferase [Eubacteriales bacterium]
MTLDCIENVRTESIMLKVQAPFSALMMLLGSDRAFRWICAYPAQMHRALRTLTEKTEEFCIEAISKGMSIVSLADPSGMLELLGEKRYKEFCAFYVVLLVRRLSPYLDNAAVHICPRTSLLLEKFGLLQSENCRYDSENYAGAVLELSKKSSDRILGHKCINDEFSKDRNAYILTLNHPQVKVRLMKESDWEAVSEIYNEGISTRNITIVKELPEKKRWLSEHKKCLVAEYLGNIIGFAAVNNKVISEISVYVERDFHCEGVGSQLLSELQNQTEGRLRSVIFESNIPSIRLHEKMGFRKTDEFCFDNDARRVAVYDWEASDE